VALNKVDLLPESEIAAVRKTLPAASTVLATSGATRRGLTDLVQQMAAVIDAARRAEA
jgi:50S ribosomal subunit-associated GTPase HflX